LIAHLFVLTGLAILVALLAGASARLPRLGRVQTGPDSEEGRPLPAEIRQAVEAGMAGLPLLRLTDRRAGPAVFAPASDQFYRTRHQVAAAIRHQSGAETATAVAIPSAGRKSDRSSSDDSPMSAPGS
jgi:hypothetical protein